jgi:hypothetical protein
MERHPCVWPSAEQPIVWREPGVHGGYCAFPSPARPDRRGTGQVARRGNRPEADLACDRGRLSLDATARRSVSLRSVKNCRRRTPQRAAIDARLAADDANRTCSSRTTCVYPSVGQGLSRSAAAHCTAFSAAALPRREPPTARCTAPVAARRIASRIVGRAMMWDAGSPWYSSA